MQRGIPQADKIMADLEVLQHYASNCAGHTIGTVTTIY